jgi:hypothetical protein
MMGFTKEEEEEEEEDLFIFNDTIEGRLQRSNNASYVTVMTRPTGKVNKVK